MTWRLAWRNLWRHRSRSWILISVIAFTYAFSLVGISIGDDSHGRMLDEARRVAGGDILVHGEGYWDSKAGDVVIPEGDAVAGLLAGVAGVSSVHPRILVSGLVSTSAASRPVFLQGVDPSVERELRDFEDDLVAGTFLGGERDDPLVLGAELVDDLEAELGDRIVLTASGPDGEITRALFHLTGVLDGGVGAGDGMLGFTTVPAAAEALGAGPSLTQIGLLLRPGVDLEDAATRATEVLAGAGDLEVLTWREAVPEMVGFVELDDAFGYLYMMVIFVVVLFAITNTFLMAVMERVREFGLLNALGLRDRQVGKMLLAETLVLTGIAMAIGLALATAGHLAADHWGISVAVWGVEEIEISGIDMADMVIRSRIVPVKWLAASVTVAVASLASALYPAWKATRLAPSEAMRFFE